MNTVNNFNLIRLLASIQVMIYHFLEHFGLNKVSIFRDFYKVLSYFPGVPIFFFISGFLIFKSYEMAPNFKIYWRNRILRIFPALLVCFIFTFVTLVVFGFITMKSFVEPSFYLWLFGQLTFLQFYTPESFRGFGLGNPNGNLWTIVVELQFYFLVSLFFLLRIKSKLFLNILFFILFWVSLALNFYGQTLNRNMLNFKLLGVSIFPYFIFFAIGIFIYINFDKAKKFLEGKLVYWLSCFILFSSSVNFFNIDFSVSYWPNFVELFYFVLLAGLIFSFAYFKLPNWLIIKNDFSYGIYLFHGILLNIVIEASLIQYDYQILFLVLVVLLFSCFSWFIIEKPCLEFKKQKHK